MATLRLEGKWLVHMPREAIYEIITDFERLALHFPAVAKSSRVVTRDGNRFVVEVTTKAFLGSRSYRVRMEGELRPFDGFVSTNTSNIGIERESFMMEQVAEGTLIRYVNIVDVRSWFYRVLGALLIRRFAVWYWKRAVIDRFETIWAEQRARGVP